MKKISLRQPIAFFMLFALAFGSFGPTLGSIKTAKAAETAKVTIVKYIDGAPATSETASNSEFLMESKTSFNDVAQTGEYSLGPNDSIPYQAVTSDMEIGSNYITREIIDETVVGSNCDAESLFSLVGYTTGDTLLEASLATPSGTSPKFTNLTSDKYVIVWNEDCADVIIDPVTSVQVTIEKYIDGEDATAENANDSDFQMTTTYTINGVEGTGEYALSENGYNGDTTPYQAKTSEMPVGSNYRTSEIIDGTVVGENCEAESPFSLVGYTTGDTMLEAENATPTMTTPDFTNMTNDKYVIVWNHDCAEVGGEIGGEVTDGPTGTLAVTSIETVDGDGVADGTFENGWEYTFNITVPTDESGLSMKFSNWTSTNGLNTILAANNIRISSEQADNSGATVLITAANVYSNPALNMNSDLDPAMDGIQVKVKVETSIPLNSVDGSYTTNYGVKTD